MIPVWISIPSPGQTACSPAISTTPEHPDPLDWTLALAKLNPAKLNPDKLNWKVILPAFLLLSFAFPLFPQATTHAQSTPAAIFTDPLPDKAHPAKMTVLHIPTHGLLINGLVYQPSGAGLHPTIVICHGLPGNEKNLDLAQALRRAGWNAVTFNYRGSWGSPGSFRFAQNLEDAAAVLDYLRTPSNAAALGVDTRRMVLAGHSMGGWVTAMTAAKDPALAGAILISAADMGRQGPTRDQLVAVMADNMESLAGVTPQTMADELTSHAKAFSIENAAPGLVKLPLLVISSDDGLAPEADALVKSIRDRGGKNLQTAHLSTDHSYSDQRIALEAEVLQWLSDLK